MADLGVRQIKGHDAIFLRKMRGLDLFPDVEPDAFAALVRHSKVLRLAATRPTLSDWAEAERSIECRLPDSYKAVFSHFGHGFFGEYLTCLVPGRASWEDRLNRLTIENLTDGVQDRKVGLRFFPDDDGWLVLGFVSTYHHMLGFPVTKDASGRFCLDRVALINRALELEVGQRSFAEFLYDVGFGNKRLPAMANFLRQATFADRPFFIPEN